MGAKKVAPISSSRNPPVNSPQVPSLHNFQPPVPPSIIPINGAKATGVNRANSRSTPPVNAYSATNSINNSLNSTNRSTNRSTNKVADFTTRQRQIPSPQTTAQNQLWLETPPRVPLPTPKTSGKPINRNFAPPTPWWLRSIFFFKYSSGFAVVGLIMAVLTTYGGIVSAQRQWTKEFQQLEALRQTERQLIAANEVIKNQVAKQSLGNQELVKVDPNSRIYIPTPDPVVLATAKSPTPTPSQSPKVVPLGY
ncbi:MAG: hypothetical protein HC916_11890 [Coleofasciculaceae cyanobacterium SM2_1_6]|nr:hypothetical protein [Coleofasciculaceae cyanobacterium SM2_1_6]